MNLEPNQEQVKSTLRTLTATFGGMIAGFFAAKGWFTADQVLNVLNSPTFIGIATSLIAGVWGWFVHSKSNAVAIVNAMPEVKGVVTQPTIAGKALSDAVGAATPASAQTVAPAGTTQASEIARK